MVAAERPTTNRPLPTPRRKRRRRRRPGFDLEQLPTTYTNKLAILGPQEEKRHRKYLTLWVKAGRRGSWRVTTV